jgi:thioredoxin reductase (NADPH)
LQQVTTAIIGAGPLGLELAAALRKIGISFVLFDKGQVAQMIADFPPQTRFFSSAEKIGIAGIPIQTKDQQKCSREEYLAYLRSVAMHYDIKINSYEEVTKLSCGTDVNFPYHIETVSQSSKYQYACRYLIIASGGTSMPRLLRVKGEDLPHVSTKMGDPHTYFQKKVLIVGAKNSAVESALRCFHAGACVALVIRKEELDPQEVKYWLLPELSGCIAKGDIVYYPACKVVEITPDNVFLQARGEAVSFAVKADFVIKAIGFEADMGLFDQLGLPLLKGDQKRPIYNIDTMETPLPGVFVLGTIVGGTQKKYRVFIENCHEHVDKIVRVICERENLVLDGPFFEVKVVSNSSHLEE